MMPTKAGGLRNRARSSIGRGLRSSTSRKASSESALSANRPRVVVEVQPLSPTRIRAYVRAPAARVKVTRPGRSTPLACGLRDSFTTRSVTATARMLTGRLTKKIQRQSRCSVSSPPRIGPAAAAAPFTAPQTPNAMPRSLPWYAPLSSAIVVANIAAPPTPCSPRKEISMPGPVARPQASEAAANSTSPPMYTLRRPIRSASEPAPSSRAASARA